MRLVLIEWVDSFGCSAHWQNIPDSIAPKPMICKSVGWLFFDGADCKVIIPHLNDPDQDTAPQQGCGDMTIPTRSVIRIKTLTVKGTRRPSRRKSPPLHRKTT